ncbi:MAG: hypothetical protein PHU85_07545 [Phycisphaerae bacterium]|nr:hypothetical protein [Phycisphaerae bacterium]
MTFSLDRDLLVFEPRLFAELAWPGQILAAGGEGSLDGVTFTDDAIDFAAAGLAPGMVLTVQPPDNAPPVALEIVSVDSDSQLTVSTLRADTAADAAAPALAGDNLDWHVISFAAQAQAVALEMLAHFGLSPANPASLWSADDIAYPDALRTLSAYGVLATVLAGAAQRGDDADGTWAKAAHYRRLFDRLLPKIRLGLDSTGDGQADVVRHLGAPRLRRD